MGPNFLPRLHWIQYISTTLLVIAVLAGHFIQFGLSHSGFTSAFKNESAKNPADCILQRTTCKNEYDINACPKCCAVEFTAQSNTETGAGICKKDENNFMEYPILSDVGNVIFADRVFYDYCICDNRCYPPQVVCYKKGKPDESVTLSYCVEDYYVYCYCKYPNMPENPCEKIWQDGRTPDCCNDQSKRLTKQECSDKPKCR